MEAAGKWGGAVVGPGTGDNMAAALGLALGLGDTVVSIGTSGTVFGVSDRPSADPTGAVAGFADATGRFLPLVCTLNAAKVLDAVRGLLGVDQVEFDRLAMAGDAGGLTLLPYFDGERTPNRPDATGVLGGLRTDVTREQLARAAVDGVVCGLLDGVDALAAHCDVDRIVLAGGGARSAAVRAVFAGSERPAGLRHHRRRSGCRRRVRAGGGDLHRRAARVDRRALGVGPRRAGRARRIRPTRSGCGRGTRRCAGSSRRGRPE